MTQGFSNQLFTPTQSVLTGSGAPTMVPSFIGQDYIDTSSGNMYKASGTSGSWNWGFIGAGQTSAFTKSTIASLYMWFDINNYSSLTLSGSEVTNITDQSGNGRDLNTVGAAGTRPTYTLNVWGSKSGIYFDGNNDRIISSTFAVAISQPLTVIAVVKNTNWGTGTYQVAIGVTNTNNGYILEKGSGDTSEHMYFNSEVDMGVNLGNNSYVWTGISNGATSKTKTNGGSWYTAPSSPGASTSNALVLGSTGNSAYWWQGYIGEVLYFNAGVSDADIARVETYLNNKWAIY